MPVTLEQAALLPGSDPVADHAGPECQKKQNYQCESVHLMLPFLSNWHVFWPAGIVAGG